MSDETMIMERLVQKVMTNGADVDVVPNTFTILTQPSYNPPDSFCRSSPFLHELPVGRVWCIFGQRWGRGCRGLVLIGGRDFVSSLASSSFSSSERPWKNIADGPLTFLSFSVARVLKSMAKSALVDSAGCLLTIQRLTIKAAPINWASRWGRQLWNLLTACNSRRREDWVRKPLHPSCLSGVTRWVKSGVRVEVVSRWDAGEVVNIEGWLGLESGEGDLELSIQYAVHGLLMAPQTAVAISDGSVGGVCR